MPGISKEDIGKIKDLLRRCDQLSQRVYRLMVPSPEELRNGIANKVDKSSRQTALDIMRRIPIEALVPAGVSITKLRDLSIVNLAQRVSAYQLYILQDYVQLDTATVTVVVSEMPLITMVVSLIASFVVGPISDKIGRRKAPVCLACALFAIGIAMPWVFKSAMGMLLFAGVAGFGYGVYSAVDQALNVDVLPNKADAGKDLGFLNIATCAGQALGSAATSSIVSATGSYLTVFPIAIVMAVASAGFVLSIKGVK